MASNDSDVRVLVTAPIGRDATLITQVLAQASVACHVCEDVSELLSQMAAGVGAVVIAQEALNPASIANIADFLRAQPPWSGTPSACA